MRNGIVKKIFILLLLKWIFIANPAQCSNGIVITIDGINPKATGTSSIFGDSGTGYIYSAFDIKTRQAISESIGPIQPFYWNNDPGLYELFTGNAVKSLTEILKTAYAQTKSTKSPLVLVSHSWGTVIAYIALHNNQDIVVDKFITLGSPLESKNPYVWSYTLTTLNRHFILSASPLENIKVWHNYWSECDWISNNITAATTNRRFDVNATDPNLTTCHRWYDSEPDAWNEIVSDVLSTDTADTCQNIRSSTPKPLATAIVFDKSGSMADERKIDYAREASFTYAREMKSEDLLSLSAFSSDAATPAGLEIKSKELIFPNLVQIMPTLQPDGQTNIGSGLAAGMKQLCSVPSDQVKKGALLLSDGMNNVGNYDAIVTDYRDLGIPIYTVKFGKEASEKDLREIAAKTSGIYLDSDTTNLTDAYRYIYAAINGDSVRIASHDPMGPNDSLSYKVDVSSDAKALQVGTSWQGSRLKTVLTSPSGAVYSGNQLPNQTDRFEAGPITQFTQINTPETGRWQIDLTWDDPPPATERVNLFVSEHSDVYVSLYGFSPEYSPGQQVTMNVHAAELDGGNNKIPLKNVRIRAKVQIPGPEVIRIIQAQGTNVRVTEDISQKIYRDVELFDDGQHADYNEGDGIFGGIFSETSLKGSYIVSVHIDGERTNGTPVSRDSRGAFHVGPLLDNEVFTSDLMQYAQQFEERMKPMVLNPLGKMQGNEASGVEPPATGKKTQSRSLMDRISN